MNLRTKFSLYKKISVALAVIMIFEMTVPTVALALTSGPGSPEFSSFEPVATTSMVNEFSGQFIYNIPVINIPGPNGTGYSMSLSYHSGDSPESESSWVGAGWTLNPGALMRTKRGYADDVKRGEIIFSNEAPDNWTIAVNGKLGAELIGSNHELSGVGISSSGVLKYNNYKGFGYSIGVDVACFSGGIGMGLRVDDGNAHYSYNLNPLDIINHMASKNAKNNELKRKPGFNLNLRNKSVESIALSNLSNIKYFSSNAFNDICRPASVVEYSGSSSDFSISALLPPTPFQFSPEIGGGGSYTKYKNIPIKTEAYMGYLHSSQARSNIESKMDYYIEKESNYNERDLYLPIPFSNADNYSATGEGVIGGFRAHSLKSGHFRPNKVTNDMTLETLGGDVSFPTNPTSTTIGLGFNISMGSGENTIEEKWCDAADFTDIAVFSDGLHENYCFRFNNDLGGNVLFGEFFQKDRAEIEDNFLLPGFQSRKVGAYNSFQGQTTSGDNYSGKINMSHYIAYNTNSEMQEDKFLSYDKTNEPVERTDSKIQDQIGEFSVVNEDGKTYIYGLPVYSMNESQYSYYLGGVASVTQNHDYTELSNITTDQLSSDENLDCINGLKKVGQIDKTPYANNYLLTAILDQDYVDVNNNGPDEADLGGWVKFSYTKVFGGDFNSSAGWYKWRDPYKGLNYHENDQIDDVDETGSVSIGYKEVYYLDKIETRTHVAKFNISDRKDCMPAHGSELSAAQGSAYAAGQSSIKPQKLDAIVLYAKAADDGLQLTEIQKVNFKYNYSSWPNTPNSIDANGGRLTLEKIWIENNGIVNAKIAPYEFEYEYPTYDQNIIEPSLANYVQAPIIPANPSRYYDRQNCDRWGYYQVNGDSRKNNMQDWVDQKPSQPFDPALWQLKVIKLPSGGEIHVQYEQNDYTYVQNRRAMVMVPITNYDNENKVITFNISSLLDVTTGNIDDYVNLLNNGELRDMYFKFLYNMNDDAGIPQLYDRKSDFIDGFVPYGSASVNPDNPSEIQITYKGDETIKGLCREYVNAEKNGKLNRPNVSEFGNTPSLLEIKDLVSSLNGYLYKVSIGTLMPDSYCTKINNDYSYIRLPVYKKKLGGGIRVKRLLMYEANNEFRSEESGKIYGNDYYYANEDDESSGVATNEPQVAREENALVLPMAKRESQSDLQLIFAGRDREEFEGPIGESILPQPSVGYNRVLIKNIFSGKTNTGVKELTFKTTRQFPFDGYYSALFQNGVSNTTINTKPKDDIFYTAFGIYKNTFKTWKTQGYSFLINKMNGQLESEKVYVYKGEIDVDKYLSKSSFLQQFFVDKAMTCTYSKEIEYYKPGEKVQVSTGKVIDGVLQSEYNNMGVENETVHESRSVSDYTFKGDIEVSLELGIASLVFLPYVLGSGGLSFDNEKLCTHVTTKVTTFPCIQKKVSVSKNGVKAISENLVFDKYTGNPIVVKSYDEYDTYSKNRNENSYQHDGSYTNVIIPASHAYEGMGQKSQNERFKYGECITGGAAKSISLESQFTIALGHYLSINVGSNSQVDLCNLSKTFSTGDLLRLNIGNVKYHYYIKSVEVVSSQLLNLYLEKSSNEVNNLPESTTACSCVEIIKSGKANLLNEVAAQYTLYQSSYDPSNFSATIPAQLLSVCNIINGMIVALSYMTTHPINSNIASISQSINLDFCGFTVPIPVSVSRDFDQQTNDITLKIGVGKCKDEDIVFSRGQFLKVINSWNGWKVLLSDNTDCNSTEITCINCALPAIQEMRVVASMAKDYSSGWKGNIVDAINNGCSFENGENGKWRLLNEYIYKTGIASINPNASLSGNTLVSRIQDGSGTYVVTPYKWNNNNPNWTLANQITKYCSNGSPVEQKNILKVFSSAKYGFNSIMPVLVASDASYASTLYEHFEMNRNNAYESGIAYSSPNAVTNTSHSGKSCYRIPMNGILTLPVIERHSEGVNIKLWRKLNNANSLLIAKINTYDANSNIINSDQPIVFFKIASSGEWGLFEGNYKFDIESIENIKNYIITINNNHLPLQPIYIDDLIVKPIGSSVNTYVFDIKNYKLITSFDNDHFGTYYQYNSEGKLVRKIIETKKGKKTVQSNNYNIPLKVRL
jgi:hypothetical protein